MATDQFQATASQATASQATASQAAARQAPDIQAPAILEEGLPGLVLRFLARSDLRPTPEQAAAFREWERVGDPVADALVAAMRSSHGVGRRQLEQALEHGIESVPDPLPELVAYLDELERTPYWVDPDQLQRASGAMGRLPLATLVSLTAAVTLPGSYVSPRVNEILIRGGDLDRRAAGRVLETVEWLVACARPGGLERFGEGFKTTARIRIVHAYIRAGISQVDGEDDGAGVPVSQLHCCVTMIPLVAAAVGSVGLGHLQSRAEREATVHLYRYMAHLMGVVPQLQAGSLDELYRLVWLAAWSEVDPDESSQRLTTAVLAAAEELLGLPAGHRARRPVNWAVRRAHHDLTRLAMGNRYADAVGVQPASPLAALLPVVAAGNAARATARRIIPGANARASERGNARRDADLQRLKARIATVPFARDQAVETITQRAATGQQSSRD